MKTQSYETSPGALVALLDTRQFVWADLYTFTLIGQINSGVPLMYCTGDIDIGIPFAGTPLLTEAGGTILTEAGGTLYGVAPTGFSQLWTHGGPLFDQSSSHGSKSTAHWKIGLDTDTWNVVIQPRHIDPVTGATYPDKIGNTGWLAAARAGALDGAVVTIQRAYLPAWPSYPVAGGAAVPTGTVIIFTGRVAAVDIGRTAASFTLNSHLELLDLPMPRNLYQAPCIHTLFDVGCTLNAASFAVSTTISSVGSASTIYVPNQTLGGSGTATLGRLVCTSGQNQGFSRTIRTWDAGDPALPAGTTGIGLIAPLPFLPAVGDAVTIYPGCDKQLTTCAAFNNIPNYGGETLIPPPELAA
ncbi:MAG: phage BR0599 family protein [Bradyrhizobium sp.]|nr:phage BR0599 family protein [Bradyrhizobium sp.]